MIKKQSSSSYKTFLYKFKAKFSSIMLNIKIYIILIVCAIYMFYIFMSNHLQKEFYKGVEAITKNIAFNFETSEKEMDRTLKAASVAISAEFAKSVPSQKKLIDLVERLQVSGISFYNKDGFMVLTNRDVLDDSYKNPFYREISIIDTDQCATQKCGAKLCRTKDYEILNCKIKRSIVKETLKNPNIVHEMPMMFMFNDTKKVPAKWVHFYNPHLNQIVDVLYSGMEISTILGTSLSINNGSLIYVAVNDNAGNLIAESGVQDPNSVKIKIPFGKEWHLNIDGKDVIYFYTLYAEFKSKELSKQIWIIRLLFILIAGLFLLVLVAFGAKLKIKENGINALKNIIAKESTFIKK